MHHNNNTFLRALLFVTGISLTLASFPIEAQIFGVYRQLWSGLSTNLSLIRGAPPAPARERHGGWAVTTLDASGLEIVPTPA